MPKLVDLPGSMRLVAGCFALAVLGFALLAQLNLWVQDGGGRMPTVDQVLWKYHGKPRSSRLHVVLDPALPEDSPIAMWPFLGRELEIEARRAQILDWVDAGAPEQGWERVAPIFAGAEACGQCHVVDGQKSDTPFTTYADVRPFTRQDTGMARGSLLISAHNHMFGFTVLALLLSVGLCLTRVGGIWRTGAILAVFAGPVFDIGGWLLTSAYGAPFPYLVMLGGALFGATSTAMALAILFDALRIRAR